MKTKSQRLLEEAAAAAKAARAIAEKAEADNRDMTADERSEFQTFYKTATDKKKLSDAAKIDEDVLATAKAWGAEIGLSDADTSRGTVWAKAAGAAIHQAMPSGPSGRKSIVSGAVSVGNVIDPEVHRIGVVPTSILDLIPLRPFAGNGTLASNSFRYLRQTVRTNNAAPVADGALKPTSVFTLDEIEDRFRVIAHLSEPVPLRYFADYALLEDFLRSEMEYGLMRALEAEVVSGDGTDEHFTGLLNTSGVVAVAAVTGDLVATLRKAITALQGTGTTPTAFVLNPNDMEDLDLVREGTGTGQYLLGGPGSAADRSLWDIPRVPSTAIAAGTALLGDWNLAELVQREGAEVAIDTGGENFTKNLATMRVEGRFGWACKRPAGFAKITLPA